MKLIRTDRASLGRHASRTPEGYIEDQPIVTRTGVFTYMGANGEVRNELRHPDDVFSSASLATLSMLPVTMGHPAGMVTAENAKALAIGFTGETPQVDGPYIRTTLRITDAEAVAQVEAGIRELSLGYAVELVEEAGEYNGKPYTHRQTDIRYNHLAVVNEARAGAMARLNVDAADQVTEPGESPNRKDTTLSTLTKIRLDNGIDYEAAPEVAHAIATLRADGEAKAEALTAATARADKAEAERDAATEKLSALEKKDTAADIAAAVKSRLTLLKAGEAAGLKADALEAMNDREIREAVIKADSAEVSLDGKSEDYVQARFDAALESIGKRQDGMANQRAATFPRQDGSTVNRVDDARAKMIAGLDYRTREQATV